MFNPDNPDKVFHDLTDPSLTLRDVAEIHNTTLESLTLWMSHPDITARLDNFQSAIARRVRLLALNYLPAAVSALHATLIAHNDQELNVPLKPDCIKTREFQRRSRETARKAASLLLRLTRFDTTPAPRSNPKQNNPDPHNLHDLRAARTSADALELQDDTLTATGDAALRPQGARHVAGGAARLGEQAPGHVPVFPARRADDGRVDDRSNATGEPGPIGLAPRLR
jgi:hypothetical protein